MSLQIGDAGLANIISLCALAVAGFAVFKQAQAGRRSAALERERFDIEREDRASANVSVRLLHYKNQAAWEVRVMNKGPSVARNIDFSAKALKDPDSALRLTHEKNLPIAVLQAGGHLDLPAAGGWGESWDVVGPPYEVTLSWNDGRPGRQQEIHTITYEPGIEQAPP